jgi:uncharacterized damage-inducible protein DinB
VKDEERPEPPYASSERETLVGFLDYQRATLEWKCAGLTDDQLRVRGIPPSSMSLLGLVRHLTEVEHNWFAVSIDGRPPALRYWHAGPDFTDTDWEVDDADVAASFAAWRDEVEVARGIVASSESLDRTFVHPVDGPVSLRWVLVHMIEEYARHNGHADLLREQIDGSVGE